MTGNLLLKKYASTFNKYKNTRVNCSSDKSEDKLIERGLEFQFDEGAKNLDVLFVGINPSYNGIKSEAKHYTKQQSLNHHYFKSFVNIEKSLINDYSRSISWSHIDLLVFRETKQSFIKDRLLKHDDGVEFIWQQLQVSKSYLEWLNPKVLVIANSLARTLFGADKKVVKGKVKDEWLGYDFIFDKTSGTRKIANNPGFEPYVFFTSMLSGQRALDNGSKERLVWHIDRILKKTGGNNS